MYAAEENYKDTLAALERHVLRLERSVAEYKAELALVDGALNKFCGAK